MSQNKILLNHGVITKGGGSRRVVLDYDAGLIYSYQSPDYIVGVFEPGRGWVVVQKPAYYSGGWGRPATGDADGHHTISNALDLVRAIGGRVLKLNAKEFLDQRQFNALNAEIREHNRVLEKRADIARRMGRDAGNDKVYPLETLEVKSDTYYNSRNCTSTRGTDPIRTARRMEQAALTFTERKGRPLSIDGYSISRDLIKQGDVVVAFRDASGSVYMNSQTLALSRFESEFLGGQSLIQSAVRKIATYSIPFNVLASAGLTLAETRVLESGPESDHTVNGRARHFTGALLLENSGRKFLMDIDRREIECGIFNAFFVEVNAQCTSIASAYESMIPDIVRTAQSAGTEVLRQGEWFFIDTGRTVTVPTAHVFSGDWYRTRIDESKRPTAYLMRSHIQHGKGRPNTLFKPHGFTDLGDAQDLVCGTVEHTGREHAPLKLGDKIKNGIGGASTREFKIWRVVPNTTVSNFTITGDVD